MNTSKKSSERERGTWRMGVGAVLFVIGMNSFGTRPTLLGLLLLVLGAALFAWGLQRAFVGPSIPRLGRLLERTGRELSA